MTATTGAPTETAAAAPDTSTPRGSLLRAEVRRFTARRFIRVLLLLAVVGYLIVTPLVAVTQFAKPSAAGLVEARQRINRIVAEQNQQRDECLKQPVPAKAAGVPADEMCGPPASPDSFDVAQFVGKRPFQLRSALPAGALAMGAAVAALAFVFGATYVGAEWSSRSMVALLFWEPRRVRVMAVKLGVIAAAAVALAVVAQGVWLASAELMARTRGSTDGLPAHFWSQLVAQQGRSTLLVVVAALLGFGIANLVRNTGAALGVGFVYFAVVETAIRGFRPGWQQWLLTDNAVALVSRGGHRLYLADEGYVDKQGSYVQSGREVVMSNLHGGLVLGLVTAALLAVGVWTFRRRDLH